MVITGHQGARDDFGKSEVERVSIEIVRGGGCISYIDRICAKCRRSGGIFGTFEGQALSANLVCVDFV